MRFAQGGTKLVVFDIGAEPAFFDMNFTARWMRAKQASGLFGGFSKKINSTVDADFKNIIIGCKTGKFALIFQIRAKPAKTSLNHITGFGMRFNIAWQRQQVKRSF